MAYIPKDPNLEDDQNQGNETPGVPPAAGESSALGTGAAPGGTTAGKATPQNRTASSSGFTNLNKYVSANQPQAEALGGQIKSKIGESINQAATKASEADKGYAEKVNPNQYQFDQKTFDPMKQNKAQFQNLFSAPKSSFGAAGEVDAANKAIEEAKTKVGQIDTIGGRKELIGDQQSLSKAAGANTAGMRSFDNLLLQSSRQGQDALAAAKGDLEAAGLEDKLKSAQERAKAVDAQALARQQQAAAQAKSALENSYGALTSGIDQRVQAQQAAGRKAEEALLNKVKNFESLSQPELAQLGISKAQWDSAKKLASSQAGSNFFDQGLVGGGWDMTPYIERLGDYSSLGRGNVITGDEIAKAKALQDLAGISGSNLDFKSVPMTQAGFNDRTVNFNIDQFLQDVAAPVARPAVDVASPTKKATKSATNTLKDNPVSKGYSKAEKEVKGWFS